MAEPTIQLGGGNWAGKTDNLLGYYKEGERFYKQDFTFSRTTTGTYTDSDGYIQEMPYNLLQQSNDFDTTWTLSASIDLTSGQSGYNGSNDAWLLKRNSTGSRYVKQNLTRPSGQYSFSVYLKAESTDWVYVWAYDGSTTVNAYFDLNNGVVGNTSGLDSTNVVSVGNDWYRCTITFTQAITSVRIYPAYANGSISTGTDNGIYIQDAQLNKGTSAKTYFPTTTRLNMPRVDYLNNSNGTLLVEPQRTNLLPYSDLSSGFTTTNVTLSNNQGTSPDGTSNAAKALMASGTGTHRVYDAINSSLNDDNVLSVFIKEQNDITHIGLNADTMSGVCWFSGSDGSIINANGLDAKTESFGNGWHRISVYYVADENDAGDNQFIYFSNRENASPNVPFDGTEEILLYGIQAEKGSFPTSYIPTSGTSVTRAYDNFNRYFDEVTTQGTIFIDFEQLKQGGGDYRFRNPSNQNSYAFYYYGGGIDVYNGAAFIVDRSTLEPNNSKIAVSWNGTSVKVFINGNNRTKSNAVASIRTTSQVIFTDTIDIANLNEIKVYDTQLTDEELINLTT